MTHEHHDRDVIIDRDDGTGVGTILGIILAVLVVLAIVWFFFLGGFGENNQNPGAEQNQQVEINPPAPGDQPPASP